MVVWSLSWPAQKSLTLPLTPSDRVVFGTKVSLENVDDGTERTWRIVGETEADIENGLISYKSPLVEP